jgi:hypothetical protein
LEYERKCWHGTDLIVLLNYRHAFTVTKVQIKLLVNGAAYILDAHFIQENHLFSNRYDLNHAFFVAYDAERSEHQIPEIAMFFFTHHRS